MELRHLRYFVTVAGSGTVSAAAERLHVTQPGLSRQLRQFEHELGISLFDRSGGRLKLSSAGRALLPPARELLDRVDAFRAAATFHAEGRLERFTIGAPTVTLTDVVAPFIATMATDDPTADVLDTDGVSSTTALGRGADLVIGSTQPAEPYDSRPLAVLPVWAYVPVGHPWAGRQRVMLTDLGDQPLIALPPAFTARESLDAALAEAHTPASFMEAANGTVAQALAAAGRGVAVVTDDPRYELVPLPVELPDGGLLSIRLVTVWDSRHAAADTLQSVARRLSDFVCERYGVPSA